MQKLTLTSKVKFLEAKYKKAVGKYLDPGLRQKDLTYLEFVLVSSGVNENFDGYPKQRIAQVHKTPIYKPIDIGHLLQEKESYLSKTDEKGVSLIKNVNTIVGSIVDAVVVDDEGEMLSEEEIEGMGKLDGFNADDPIHVVCLAVLYDFFFPQTVRDLKKMVEAGGMFVSVEAFFTDWDYYLMEKSELIKRDESTEFLDSYIATSYKGSTVARVLNDFIIGGAGFTSFPANPSSIILSLNNEDTKLTKQIQSYLELHDKIHSIYPTAANMDDNTKAEIEKVHARLTKKIKNMVMSHG